MLVFCESDQGASTTGSKHMSGTRYVSLADPGELRSPWHICSFHLENPCWQAFDSAVQRAADRELRKGPRGGGRDLEKILDHVLEADQGYLARLAWKHKSEGGKNPVEELSQTRQAILNALEVAVNGDLPEQGPRGGIIWSGRYFIRRVAWHVLDHAWEIDDRIV